MRLVIFVCTKFKRGLRESVFQTGYSPKSKLPADQQRNTSKARKRKLLPALVGKPAHA